MSELCIGEPLTISASNSERPNCPYSLSFWYILLSIFVKSCTEIAWCGPFPIDKYSLLSSSRSATVSSLFKAMFASFRGMFFGTGTPTTIYTFLRVCIFLLPRLDQAFSPGNASIESPRWASTCPLSRLSNDICSTRLWVSRRHLPALQWKRRSHSHKQGRSQSHPRKKPSPHPVEARDSNSCTWDSLVNHMSSSRFTLPQVTTPEVWGVMTTTVVGGGV